MGAIDYAIKKFVGDVLDSGDAPRAGKAPFEELVTQKVAADADGAFTEVRLAALTDDYEFVAASWVQGAIATASVTDFFTLSILKYNASGASGITIATMSGSAGLTAKAAKAFTAVAGTQDLVSGGSLALVGAATGSGASLSEGALTVRLRRRN